MAAAGGIAPDVQDLEPAGRMLQAWLRCVPALACLAAPVAALHITYSHHHHPLHFTNCSEVEPVGHASRRKGDVHTDQKTGHSSAAAAPALWCRRPGFANTARLAPPQAGSYHPSQPPRQPYTPSPASPAAMLAALPPGGPPGERALADRAARQLASRLRPPAGRPQPSTLRPRPLPPAGACPARPLPSAGPRGGRRPAIGRWGGRAAAPAAAAPPAATAGRAGAPVCCRGAAAVQVLLLAMLAG